MPFDLDPPEADYGESRVRSRTPALHVAAVLFAGTRVKAALVFIVFFFFYTHSYNLPPHKIGNIVKKKKN